MLGFVGESQLSDCRGNSFKEDKKPLPRAHKVCQKFWTVYCECGVDCSHKSSVLFFSFSRIEVLVVTRVNGLSIRSSIFFGESLLPCFLVLTTFWLLLFAPSLPFSRLFFPLPTACRFLISPKSWFGWSCLTADCIGGLGRYGREGETTLITPEPDIL